MGFDLIELALLDPSATDVAMTKQLLADNCLGVTCSLGLGAEADVSSEDRAVVARAGTVGCRFDLATRRARVTRKGGDIDVAHRAGAHPPLPDLDAASGFARLRYRHAAAVFNEASGGRTLHQLGHPVLAHLAEANVSLPPCPNATARAVSSSPATRGS